MTATFLCSTNFHVGINVNCILCLFFSGNITIILKIYYVLVMVLGTRNTAINKLAMDFHLRVFYVRDIGNKQYTKMRHGEILKGIKTGIKIEIGCFRLRG